MDALKPKQDISGVDTSDGLSIHLKGKTKGRIGVVPPVEAEAHLRVTSKSELLNQRIDALEKSLREIDRGVAALVEEHREFSQAILDVRSDVKMLISLVSAQKP